MLLKLLSISRRQGSPTHDDVAWDNSQLSLLPEDGAVPCQTTHRQNVKVILLKP